MKLFQSIFLGVAVFVITTSATAGPKVNVITAGPGYPPEEKELQMCSLGCAMGWETKASSHLKSKSKYKYDINNIDDFRIDTAWIEGVKGHGIGESLTFIFTKEAFDKANIGNEINFNGFLVVNGYNRTKKTWKENSRVKSILISHNEMPIYEAILHDSMNIQEIDFDNIFLRPGDRVQVRILSVYPGDKYQDTAISELIPTGAH